MKWRDQSDVHGENASEASSVWRILGWAAMASVLWLQGRYFALSLRDSVLHRDEANDIFTALQSWPELLRHFATDWVPYVYLLALKFWMAIFGTSELAVRSLSFWCICGACLLLYRPLRIWWGPLAAATGTAVVGLSPVVLQYPVIDFARPYAMALLLSCWAFDRFVALVRAPVRRNWIWFGMSVALAANIQPVNLGFLAALPLGALLLHARLEGWHRGIWSQPLRMGVCVLLLSVPTLVQAVRFREGQGDARADLSQGVAHHLTENALRMVGWVAPWVPEVANYAANDDLSGVVRAWPAEAPRDLLLLATISAAAWLWMVGTRRRWVGEDLTAICLAVCCTLYLLMSGIGNARMMVSWKCYSGLAVGMATALLAVLRPSRILLALVLILSILRAAAAYVPVAHSKTGRLSDAKDASAYLAAYEREGDFVVLDNLVLSPTFSYYFRGRSRQWHHPYDGPLKVWHATELWQHVGESWRVDRTVRAVRAAVGEGRRIWLVTGDIDETQHPPERWHRWYSPDAHVALRDELEATCRMVESKAFRQTAEPYRVTLFTPSVRDAGGEE